MPGGQVGDLKNQEKQWQCKRQWFHVAVAGDAFAHSAASAKRAMAVDPVVALRSE
jgi:hypothetical protein